MPEDEVLDDPKSESTYHRRVVTTETVKRGDLYVPLADRFSSLERRVSLLTWVVIIDMLLTLGTNGGIFVEVLKVISRLTGV